MRKLPALALILLLAIGSSGLYAQQAPAAPMSPKERLDLLHKQRLENARAADAACRSQSDPQANLECKLLQFCLRGGKSHAECTAQRQQANRTEAACKGTTGDAREECFRTQRCLDPKNQAICAMEARSLPKPGAIGAAATTDCSKISPAYGVKRAACERGLACAQDSNPKLCEERRLSGAGESSGASQETAPDPEQNAHLAEMPSVQKVMQTTQGRGPRDALARAAATFTVLGFLVQQDANPRKRTAQQSARLLEYRRSWESIVGEEQAKNDPECFRNNSCESQPFTACMQGYSFNASSVRAILDQYFSPAWQARYVASKPGNMWRDALALPAGTPPYNCADLPGSGQISASAAAGGVKKPADPGTGARSGEQAGQAGASGVDMTVFGIVLGSPVRLPDCKQSPTSLCQARGGLIASLYGYELSFSLPSGRCPAWMSAGVLCSIPGDTVNGQLASLIVVTKGTTVEEAVAAQLIEKYGRPSKKTRRNMQNSFGAKLAVDDLEWTLPGLHVMFKPMGESDPDSGFIVIETDAGHQARQARESKQKAKQPKI